MLYLFCVCCVFDSLFSASDVDQANFAVHYTALMVPFHDILWELKSRVCEN